MFLMFRSSCYASKVEASDAANRLNKIVVISVSCKALYVSNSFSKRVKWGAVTQSDSNKCHLVSSPFIYDT